MNAETYVTSNKETNKATYIGIIGLHGNREFELDCRPAPYVDFLSRELRATPSLYDFQRARRLQRDD